MEQTNKEELNIEELKQKLAEAEKMRDEYLSGWQRAKADFINFQKDEGERIAWLKKQIDRAWLLKILDFYDDLELAKNHLPDELKDNDWIKANLAIYDKLLEELKKDGLEQMKTLGERFNPEFHEAIEEIEGKGETGTIAEIVKKGYLFGGELLRPAKVKVFK